MSQNQPIGTQRSTQQSFFTGTGSNLCYMEELRNIEKAKQNSGNVEREEGRQARAADKVDILEYVSLVRYVCLVLNHFLTGGVPYNRMLRVKVRGTLRRCALTQNGGVWVMTAPWKTSSLLMMMR